MNAAVIQNISPRGRIALVASALGVVVVMFLLFQLASRPSLTTLVSGIDPAQTGKATKLLDEQGIAYELRNNGTAIAVDKDRTADARVALAGSGLGGADQPGFELFDKQKIGASSFQQQVSYQRALEGEIARSIGQVNGVSGAQVQLVLPEDDLFTEESDPATAAVVLNADALDPSAVRGIAQLTASSVKGLKPARVTITDQTGALLWPTGEEGVDGGVAGGGKQALDTRYARSMEASLGALVAQTVGADKARVRVHADLDANATTKDELVYARRGTPLKSRTETEQLEGGAGGAGGTAGTTGNTPTYPQGTGAANSNYQRESEETEFGVDKTVTRTKVAPGTVKRLDVALLVDAAVPAKDAAALQDAVRSAAGLDPERGDTMTMKQVKFAKPPEAPGASPVSGALGAAKYVGLALGLALFGMFVARHLRRREAEALADPTWLREIAGPRPLSELTASRDQATVVMPPPAPQHARRQVETIADREPEKVAAQVRAWMTED